MARHPLDHPVFIQPMFFPRHIDRPRQTDSRIQDGTIPLPDGESLGYRFFLHQPNSPVILLFHGNGEICTDYNHLAPLYRQVGAALLVIDYRGYGWSTGHPLFTALTHDAETVLSTLPNILKQAGATGPLFVKGRSLGSIPAIHLAYTAPEHFRAIMIECGIANMPWIWRITAAIRLAFSPESLPTSNLEKMKSITLPLLVIHGERDQILPVKHGQQLYDASPSEDKDLLRVPEAGHNDLMLKARETYFMRIKALMSRALTRH